MLEHCSHTVRSRNTQGRTCSNPVKADGLCATHHPARKAERIAKQYEASERERAIRERKFAREDDERAAINALRAIAQPGESLAATVARIFAAGHKG